MAAFPLARLLLALACFALLLADCSARRRHSKNRRNNGNPGCGEAFIGSATSNVVVLPDLASDAYSANVNVNNIDHCYPKKKLAGALITACDPTGAPAPSILTPSILSQIVTCHTQGPCTDGLIISVTQYCQ